MQDAPQPAPSPVGRPSRFYYGWVIVVVFFVVEFLTYATSGSTITLFFAPMQNDLGWSLTQLTGAVTASVIASMIVAPIIGPLLDRFGARPILIVSGLAAGIALVLMSRVQFVWQYWLLFAFIGAMGMGEMGRLSTPVVVTKWFVRKRGRALAIASSGGVAGGTVMAPVVGWIIDRYGWEAGWLMLAGGILFISLPLVVLFMRRVPEDMGLRPDGDPPDLEASQTANARRRTYADEAQWTLAKAYRTRALWFLVAGSNLISFATSSVSYHQVTFFVNEGMSVTGAAYVLSASLALSVGARFLWGFIVERYSVRWSLAVMAGFRALGTLSLVVVPYPFNIPTFVVGWGLLGGAFGLLQPIAWADYYGRGFQGSIQGTLRPLLQASRLVAPLLMAVLFDLNDSYTVAFALAGAVAGVAVVLYAFAAPPVLKVRSLPPEGEG